MPPKTAEEYAYWVRQLAAISPRATLFSVDCTRLARFLDDAQKPNRPRHEAPPDFAHEYELPRRARNAPDDAIARRASHRLCRPPAGGGGAFASAFSSASALASTSAEASLPPNRILYLSGYPSAHMLAEMGAKYQIDPEFFDRHLSFLGTDSRIHCEYHPPHHVPPSQQPLLLQLSIPSIGRVPTDTSFKDWGKKNESLTGAMAAYMHNLRMGQQWRPYHSVVRAMELHDTHRFSVEQYVTVCVIYHPTDPRQWTIVIWSDAGADLSKSPPGPWLSPTHDAHFQPVKIAGPKHVYEAEEDGAASGAGSRTSRKKAPLGPPQVPPQQDVERSASGGVASVKLQQSLALLRAGYGQSLDAAEMAGNPLYALTELFRFYVASETQYLDMARAVLHDALAQNQQATKKRPSNARPILAHSSRLLTRRRDHIQSVLGYVRRWAPAPAPAPPLGHNSGGDTEDSPGSTSPAAASAADLQLDLEYLLRTNVDLVARYREEMRAITSEATFEDARRGIALSKSSHKFAQFAAIYVPLSFTCSVFGMNFVLPRTPGQAVLLWLAASLAVVSISLAFLFGTATHVKAAWQVVLLRRRRGGEGEMMDKP